MGEQRMKIWVISASIAAVVLSAYLSHQDELKKAMGTWIGAPVSAYAIRNGLPQSAFDLGPGKQIFQWKTGRLAPQVAMAMPRTNALVIGGGW